MIKPERSIGAVAGGGAKSIPEHLGNWRIAGLLMLFCFANHFNRVSMPVAGDLKIMREFSISPTEMGIVYSAFLFVYTLFMLPGGLFIDRFGPKTALAVVAFGSGALCLLTGSVGFGLMMGGSAFLTFLIIRGVMGLLSVPLHPAAARAAGAWFPSTSQAWVNGLITGAALLGVASTYRLFGGLIDRFGWPGAFLVTGSITVLIGVAWQLVAPSNREERAGAAPARFTPLIASWRRLFENRSLLWLTVSYAAIGYFQYLFFYWMHYYFRNVLGLEEKQSQTYSGIPSLVMAFTMPLGGWITGRLQRRYGDSKGLAILPVLGLIASALLLSAGLASAKPVWIVFWFALALGAVGLSEASYWTAAVNIGGRFGGSAAAFCNTGGNAGGLVAPILTPFLGERFGWGAAMSVGALVCLVGAGAWVGIKANPGAGPSKTDRA